MRKAILNAYLELIQNDSLYEMIFEKVQDESDDEISDAVSREVRDFCKRRYKEAIQNEHS